MKDPTRRLARPAPALSALALGSLLLSSCAAPLRIRGEADPLAMLEPGLAAYARLEGSQARRLLAAALPERESAALDPLLAKTRLLAAGIGREAPAGAGGPGAPGGRLLEAALLGSYPFRRASLGLAASGEWRREGAAYLHEATGVRAVAPGPELVLASTGPVEPLLALARLPGPSPIPPRLAGAAQAEIVLWLPAPFSFSALGELDLGAIPARGVLVAARPAADGSYSATVGVLMDGAESARTFRPAVRLAWYFMARALLGEAGGPALGPRFELDGDLVVATGVPLPEAALARALSLALPASGDR